MQNLTLITLGSERVKIYLPCWSALFIISALPWICFVYVLSSNLCAGPCFRRSNFSCFLLAASRSRSACWLTQSAILQFTNQVVKQCPSYSTAKPDLKPIHKPSHETVAQFKSYSQPSLNLGASKLKKLTL